MFMKDYQYHIFSPYRVCPLGKAVVKKAKVLVRVNPIHEALPDYHPRSQKMIEKRGFKFNDKVIQHKPLGFL